uniref:Large ribosomal subunit protein uL30m n=1 Tax=Oryza nivara TaxID=4536 RepID=A0A0E0I6G7_ORYNI
MSGSAFNAFKSRVAVAWSPKLYITLVRGLPGTRRLHRRTLEAMRLRRCHRTVEHRTTPSLLGMLTQVKRLVVVETQEMPRTTAARPGHPSSSPTARPPLPRPRPRPRPRPLRATRLTSGHQKPFFNQDWLLYA